MISTILIDDEIEANKGLSSLLNIFCPDVHIVAQATSVKEAVQILTEFKPQLVFLDIEMAGGTGFDILEKIPRQDFAVIFVTAYDHYAIRAIRLNALDYLLKPVDPDELTEAIRKARKTIKDSSYPQYHHAINDHKTQDFKKIGVPTSGCIQYIQFSDIIRLESSNNYTYIHTVNARPLLISKTIKSFETTLPGNQFIRCHQRHIINIDLINELVRSEKGNYIILPGVRIPVSRTYRSFVLEKLKEWHKML